MSDNFASRILLGLSLRKTGHSNEYIFKETSHLFLNDRKIEKIGDLSSFQKIKFIYLHNNLLTKIENLNFTNGITHLYLHKNRIKQIDGFEKLQNLTKLFIGHNEIATLENLNNLHQMKELHIEYQHFDGTFSFEKNCLESLAEHLNVLNISGLRLKTLECMKNFKILKQLIAKDNDFNTTESISEYLVSNQLKCVNFFGCPAKRQDKHYRDKITLASDSLEILDDKKIYANARIFMKYLTKVKANQTKKQQISQIKSSCGGEQEINVNFEYIVAEAIVEEKEINEIATDC